MVGSTFERTYRHRKYRVKVVSVPSGIVYDLDGRPFRSLSAAAKSITKYEVNGWLFWKIDKE